MPSLQPPTTKHDKAMSWLAAGRGAELVGSKPVQPDVEKAISLLRHVKALPPIQHGQRPTIAVDLDGTLAATPPHTGRPPAMADLQPRDGAVGAMQELHKLGWKIIIWTVRDDYAEIKDWLRQHDIPWDHLNNNPDQPTTSPKIIADVYADDRAVLVDDWKDTLKELKEAHRARQPIEPDVGYGALKKLGEEALPELERLLATLNFPIVHLEDTTPNELDARLHQEGPLIVIAPLKAEARATEKVESDYKGDWSRLFDVVRAAVAVDSMEELQKAAQALEEAGAVLARRPKNRFERPLANSYRDILTNIRLPGGAICEVQFHLKPILAAREKEKLAYDIVRAIRAALKEEGRDSMTTGEIAAVQRARDASKQLFEQAWLEVVQREKGEKFLGTYLMKAGYTGTFVDRLGRQTCYAGGRKIACIKPGGQEEQESPDEPSFSLDDTGATQTPQEEDPEREPGTVSPRQVYYALVFDPQGRLLVRPSDTQLGGFIWMAPKPSQETQPAGAPTQENPDETVANHLSREAGVQARKFGAIDDAEDGDGYFLLEGRGGANGAAQWLAPAEVKQRLQQTPPEWQERGQQILAVAVHKWKNSSKTGGAKEKDLLPDGRRVPKQLQMPKLLVSPFKQVKPRKVSAPTVVGQPQTKTTSAPKLTGPIQDSLGRRQCFRDGKPAPCAQFGGKGEGWDAQRSGEDLWDAAQRLAAMIKRGDSAGGDELVGMLTSAPPEDLAKLKRDHGLRAGAAREEIAQKLQEKLQSLGYTIEGQEQGQKSLLRTRSKDGVTAPPAAPKQPAKPKEPPKQAAPARPAAQPTAAPARPKPAPAPQQRVPMPGAAGSQRRSARIDLDPHYEPQLAGQEAAVAPAQQPAPVAPEFAYEVLSPQERAAAGEIPLAPEYPDTEPLAPEEAPLAPEAPTAGVQRPLDPDRPIAERVKSYGQMEGAPIRQSILEEMTRQGLDEEKARLQEELKKPDNWVERMDNFVDWAISKATLGLVEGPQEQEVEMRIENWDYTDKRLNQFREQYSANTRQLLGQHLKGNGRWQAHIPQGHIKDKQRRGHIEAVMEFVRSIISQEEGGADLISFNDAPQGQRSHATPRGIYLTQKANARTIAHEVGHYLQHNVPGIDEAVHEWMAHRLGDEQPQSLNQLFPNAGYRDNEFGRKDHFDKVFGEASAYYFGKVYEKTASDGKKPSEALAMMLEAAWTDPVHMMQADPDMFDFLCGLSRGQLRKIPQRGR